MSSYHIFVSYSHEDEPWKNRLLRQLTPIGVDSQIEVWHDRRISPGALWYSEIVGAMDRASLALCLVSEHFLRSDFCKEEIGQLLGRRNRDGLRVICLLIRPCEWKREVWIRALQMLPGDGKSIEVDFAGREDEVLASAAGSIRKILEDPDYRPTSRVVGPLPGPKENLERLRKTKLLLLGRQEKLTNLDLAWSEHGSNLVVLHGHGGLGKTTLALAWLERMKHEAYRGAEKVFGWSFSTSESGDRFMHDALAWFGDADPEHGSPWDKGERLAELVAQSRTLLVLDGMEALQQLSGIDRGRLRHAGIATLLWNLARHNPGLCVVTTRERIADVEDLSQASQMSLEQLTIEAGADLLAANDVKGPEEVLRDVSAQFNADPLGLTLLAGHLHNDPFIATLAGIPGISEDTDLAPSYRVLTAIDKQLTVSSPAAIAALRILSLFDSPAAAPAIDAIRARPVIPQLTELIPEPGKEGWRDLMEQLRDRNLVLPQNPSGRIDLHPVVREYFAGHFRQELPDAWREANSRLFIHYSSSKEPAGTMDQIAPLLSAVNHGCRAAHYWEAYEVLRLGIQRNKQDYATIKLGASAAVIEALARFFQTPWDGDLPFGLDRPEDAESHGYILSQAAGTLTRQGELREAIGLGLRCLESDEYIVNMSLMFRGNRRAERYAGICGVDANNLAELYLLAGPLSKAFEWAKVAFEWIGKTSDTFWLVVVLTTMGEILHRTGNLEQASGAFRDAEKLHAGLQRMLPELYQAQGIRYCEFLLDRGDYMEVVRRAGNAIEAEESRSDGNPDKWDADLCHDLLIMARAQLALSKVAEAEINVERAITMVRQSVDARIEAKCLHARAAVRWRQGKQTRAWVDLDRASAICRRSGMRLLQADCALTRARFQVETGERENAKETLKLAQDLVATTQYGVRQREIHALEQTLSVPSV